MKHPATRRAVLHFADAFGVTAVDARGKARTRPLRMPILGFDAKGDVIGLRILGGGLLSLDASLRAMETYPVPSAAWLPGGRGLLRIERAEGRYRLTSAGEALHEPDDAPRVTLTGAPDEGPVPGERHPVLTVSDDGGVIFPRGPGELRFGALDPDHQSLSEVFDLHRPMARGVSVCPLPGRGCHLLALHHRARGLLDVRVLTPEGQRHAFETPAVGRPVREGDSLWVQSDDDHVTALNLRGETLSQHPLPEAHRGEGMLFAQRGRACFVPWHREVVVDLSSGEVFDRALGDDPAQRLALTGPLRTLQPLARRAGVEIALTAASVRGRATRTISATLSCDGGDQGALAHCVLGAAWDWHRWTDLAGAQAQRTTGGSVVAARAEGLDALLDALGALDARGVPFEAAAAHWESVYRAGSPPLDDVAGLALARALVDPSFAPGAQASCTARGAASPPSFEAWQSQRGDCAARPAGASLARLARTLMERHSLPGSLPPMDLLVAAPSPPRRRAAR